MAKGTASKAIKELKQKGFLTEEETIVYFEEEPITHRQILDDKSYCVYKLTFPDGNLYIGITNRPPEARWQGGEGYVYNPEMYSAIQDQGWENIKKEVLLTDLTQDEADLEETKLILELSKNHTLYNKKKNRVKF